MKFNNLKGLIFLNSIMLSNIQCFSQTFTSQEYVSTDFSLKNIYCSYCKNELTIKEKINFKTYCSCYTCQAKHRSLSNYPCICSFTNVNCSFYDSFYCSYCKDKIDIKSLHTDYCCYMNHTKQNDSWFDKDAKLIPFEPHCNKSTCRKKHDLNKNGSGLKYICSYLWYNITT